MFLKYLIFNVGMACNSHCKYCFRNYNKQLTTPSKPTEELKGWLRDNYMKFGKVVVGGGESLLYLKQIKELFSCVPKTMYKRILTNGKLLNAENVKYFNDNNINVSVSYDGKISKYTRGYDILDENLENIKAINSLMFITVVTAKNLDIVDNYKYICEKLGRNDFLYVINLYLDNEQPNDEFVKNFDYQKLRKELVELKKVYKPKLPIISYSNRDNLLGTQILLNGDIVSMIGLKKYGTVFDNEDEVLENIKRDYYDCDCEYNSECRVKRQLKTDHICKMQKAVIESEHYLRRYNG